MQELPGRVGAERPESGVEIGNRSLDQVAREPADEPFGRHPKESRRALLRPPGSDHLVPAVEFLYQFGDPIVRIGEVGVGPHGHSATSSGRTRPTCGAGSSVLGQPNESDPNNRLQQFSRPVVGAVVDDNDLVGVRRRGQGAANSIDLCLEVAALVEHWKHDRDVDRRLRSSGTARRHRGAS